MFQRDRLRKRKKQPYNDIWKNCTPLAYFQVFLTIYLPNREIFSLKRRQYLNLANFSGWLKIKDIELNENKRH